VKHRALTPRNNVRFLLETCQFVHRNFCPSFRYTEKPEPKGNDGNLGIRIPRLSTSLWAEAHARSLGGLHSSAVEPRGVALRVVALRVVEHHVVGISAVHIPVDGVGVHSNQAVDHGVEVQTAPAFWEVETNSSFLGLR